MHFTALRFAVATLSSFKSDAQPSAITFSVQGYQERLGSYYFHHARFSIFFIPLNLQHRIYTASGVEHQIMCPKASLWHEHYVLTDTQWGE